MFGVFKVRYFGVRSKTRQYNANCFAKKEANLVFKTANKHCLDSKNPCSNVKRLDEDILNSIRNQCAAVVDNTGTAEKS